MDRAIVGSSHIKASIHYPPMADQNGSFRQSIEFIRDYMHLLSPKSRAKAKLLINSYLKRMPISPTPSEQEDLKDTAKQRHRV